MPHEALVTAMANFSESQQHQGLQKQVKIKVQASHGSLIAECQTGRKRTKFQLKIRKHLARKHQVIAHLKQHCRKRGLQWFPAPLNLTLRENIQLTVHICLGHQLIVQGM